MATSVIRKDHQADIDSLNSNISSNAGGVPIRVAGYVRSNESVTFPISSFLSANEGFMLLCLNLSGNALAGAELFFLGKGNSKKKALIGVMDESFYTLSYSYTTRGEWTLTNNTSDNMYYTAIISK